MLNQDALPEVQEFSGIGTADLPALAGTALTLLGERPTMGGSLIPEALDGWATEDALPFISSSALTIAQAVLGRQKLAVLLENLTLVSALSFTAMSGNAEAFSPEVAQASDSPGVGEMAMTLHRLVAGTGVAARIQDPFCLRTLPLVLGAVSEELASLDVLLTRLVVDSGPVPRRRGGRQPRGLPAGFHRPGAGDHDGR